MTYMTKTTRRVRADEAQPGDSIQVDYRDGARWGVVLYTTRKPGRIELAVSVLDRGEAEIIDMDQAIHSKVSVR